MKKLFNLKKLFFYFTFFLFAICKINAQSFQIVHAEYFVNGITSQNHLEHKIKINYKKNFNTEDELKTYLSFLKNQYTNLRIFDDIQIEYLLMPQSQDDTKSEHGLSANADANTSAKSDSQDKTQTESTLQTETNSKTKQHATAVILQIKVIDSKNFIVLPYYKYDSNDGNTFKIKMKDSNFCGTVNSLESDIYFSLLQKKENKTDFKFGGTFNYNLPFYIGLVEASWDNDLDFSYTIGKEIPEWKINTGFTFRLPFERISYDLTLKQKFINNFDYTIFDDQMYLGSDVEFAVPIKLKTIDSWGDFVYTPSVQFVDNWAFHSINKRNDDLLSPEILFCNKFSTKNINWQGNFRKGLSFYIRQDYGYNFLIEQIVIGTEAELEGFINFENFAINTRLYGFVYKNKNKKIGNRIRGIRDDEYFSQSTSLFDINSTSTPTSIVLNLDLPIKVFSTNFENMGINFLHKLNFELQISPFIDIALNRNRMTDRTFDLRDGYYCAGIEFIVFPARWKSLQVRASAGFDLGRTLLKDYIDTSWRPNVSPYELSFGIGLHY